VLDTIVGQHGCRSSSGNGPLAFVVTDRRNVMSKKKLISRRDVLRIAAYLTPVIVTMAMSPSIASAGTDNNGLHKGWFKDHDNNGLHKGWSKDHDFNNSNNNNGNPVRAVPEPGSFLLLLTGISAIVGILRNKR
jgi:hypothetical protein